MIEVMLWGLVVGIIINLYMIFTNGEDWEL